MARKNRTRALWMTISFAVAASAVFSSQTQVDGLHPINGTELYVKRMGAGQPLVIVHGGPVLEHGYLLPHLEPLADAHELIFYDQRVCGRSAPTVAPETVRLATFVEDLEALRVSLDLGRIHLVGHSWGALIAMRYAIEHQANLRSLSLLDPMSASASLWRQEEAVLAQQITQADKQEQQAIRENESFKQQEPDAIRQLLLASFKLTFADRSRIDDLELFVPDDYTERSRQFGGMIVDLTSYDLHDELREVTVPTLILYGSAEPGRKLGGAALLEAMPHAQSVTVEDAGHFPFIEQPDAFLREVREFLHTTETPPQ